MSREGIPSNLASRLGAEFAPELDRCRLHGGRLASLLTTVAGANAIVFGRRVFLSKSASACVADAAQDATRLLAHELSHVAQYRRFGAAAFLGRYVGEYLRGRLDGLDHRQAYRAISFEREAEARGQACSLALLESAGREAGLEKTKIHD